jgi:hypothetical protein
MGNATREDAALLLQVYEMRREAMLRRARTWFFSETGVLTWEERKAQYPPWSEGDRFIRMVATYWDLVAALVNHGLLDEDLFFETNGEDLILWERVKGWVGPARAEGRLTFLRHLEAMVARHQAWRDSLRARFDAAPGTLGFPEKPPRAAGSRTNRVPRKRAPARRRR